jgi:Uma2 family endonuclease
VKCAGRVEVAWYGLDRMFDLLALRPDRPRRLRRTEYMRLVDAGVFEGESVELLYGQLVTMSPQGDPHINVSADIAAMLIRQLGEKYRVRSHSGLGLWTHSCPEPAVFLVVEVAQTSHAKDRIIKAPLYAQAGIPNYWLVDLERLAVDVHTQPQGRRYGKVRTLTRRDTLRAVGLPRVAIPVARILPPPAD